MNSVVVIILGIVVYFAGMRLYSRYIDKKIIQSDARRATPARLYSDGVDFLPTSRTILFGYQFKSIAGAAPVIGPIIAIKWGWLPGLLWIILGTLFIGWVQDYTSTIVSVRSEGMTFGGISFRLISPRARHILLTFIYFYLLLIAAAFANVVATFMANNPGVPLPIIFLAIAGLVVGLLIYRGKMGLLPVTLLGLAIFFLALFAGNWIPIHMAGGQANMLLWLLFALGFAFLGSVLPIWSFVQPINYLGFYIILLGMVGVVFGIFVGRPAFTVPAFTSYTISGLPLWPLLFVTIACGAISGWHSVVSSTGTSRQLERETDARPVAAGAMFLEMILALLALIIVSVAGARGAWDKLFGAGMGEIFSYIRLPYSWGEAYGPVMIVVLAITILHLVVRFMRIATNELVGKKVPILRNPVAGTLVALVAAFILVYTGTFKYIWVLFGSANQLMASLALLICSVWLVSQKKNSTYTFIPMIFMYVTTMTAIVITCYQLFSQAIAKVTASGEHLSTETLVGNWIAGLIGAVLFVAAIFLATDGLRAFQRYRQRKQPDEQG